MSVCVCVCVGEGEHPHWLKHVIMKKTDRHPIEAWTRDESRNVSITPFFFLFSFFFFLITFDRNESDGNRNGCEKWTGVRQDNTINKWTNK